MRPSFLIIASSWMIGMLPSCSPPQFTYPYVQLEGPLRDQITSEDIRQAIEVARQQPKIRKPVKSIGMWQPNELAVISGDDPYTYFKVVRRNGRWILRYSSIEERRPIITG